MKKMELRVLFIKNKHRAYGIYKYDNLPENCRGLSQIKDN